MAVSGNIFTMEDSNTETFTALCQQLAGLLGVGKRSDGRYHLADIATAGSINPWAKNKGFGYNSENFEYDPQNPDASNARRAAARKEVNYGIVIPSTGFGNVTDMANAVYNGTYSYVYNPPTGRADGQPFRLRDFDRYDHDATPPLYDLGDINSRIYGTSADIGIVFGRNMANDDYQLSLSDLRPQLQDIGNTFDKMYFGICCRRSDGVTYYSCMSEIYETIPQSLNEVGLTVNLQAPSTIGSSYSYVAFAFFSTLPNAQAGGTLFPIPFAKTNVKVTYLGVQAITTSTLGWVFGTTTTPFYYRATVVNTTTTSRTLTYRISALKSASLSNLYRVLATGTITIPANGTVYIPSQIAGSIADSLIVQNATHIACELYAGEQQVAQVNINTIIMYADPTDPPAPIA